jgi:undecaprenyl-diphosphatase
MNILQAFVLAIVQGVTEFLPVSSSGHLIAVSQLFYWPEQPLVFDTTLHLATAATLIVFFFTDLKKLVLSFFKDVVTKKQKVKDYSKDSKLLFYILIGSIPAGILGFLLQNTFEEFFRAWRWVVAFLLLGSALMYWAQKASKKGDGKLTVLKSLELGLFQSLALFPGVSRSGSTISGGLFLGFKRKEAARLSFLMSIPVVAAAGIFELIKTNWNSVGVSIPILILGFVVSFFTGLWAVKFLLNYLTKKDLNAFIYYRIFLAIMLSVLLL